MKTVSTGAIAIALACTVVTSIVPAQAASALSATPPGSCVVRSSNGVAAAIAPALHVTTDATGAPETAVETLTSCTAAVGQPFQSFVPITSNYGVRVHPITQQTTMHYGTDYSGYGIRGTPIRSIAAGSVAYRNDSSATTGAGNTITILHAGGVRSQYMHMAAPTSFAVGGRVNAGDIIGYVGSTGGSTGPHLHLEIRVNGVFVNPAQYLAYAPHVR